MRRLLFGVVLILEFYVALRLTLLAPCNLVRVPYRQEERGAAYRALEEHRSPTTEAALREEMRLASRYHTNRELVRFSLLFAAFLALDGIGYRSWRCYRDESTMIQPRGSRERRSGEAPVA